MLNDLSIGISHELQHSVASGTHSGLDSDLECTICPTLDPGPVLPNVP